MKNNQACYNFSIFLSIRISLTKHIAVQATDRPQKILDQDTPIGDEDRIIIAQNMQGRLIVKARAFLYKNPAR